MKSLDSRRLVILVPGFDLCFFKLLQTQKRWCKRMLVIFWWLMWNSKREVTWKYCAYDVRYQVAHLTKKKWNWIAGLMFNQNCIVSTCLRFPSFSKHLCNPETLTYAVCWHFFASYRVDAFVTGVGLLSTPSITIPLRECLPGEFTADDRCSNCPKGVFTRLWVSTMVPWKMHILALCRTLFCPIWSRSTAFQLYIP